MVAWWVQLALNFLWSPVFFLARDLLLALVILLGMLAAIVAFIALARRLDRVAAWLFAPPRRRSPVPIAPTMFLICSM